MLSKMFLIPFLCIISSELLSATMMTCDTDSDCPPNHFCYLVSNFCAQCVPNFCARLNRKNSTWRKCHTEHTDCGSCLPGFEEEYLTNGETRAACLPSHRPTTSHFSGYQNSAEGSGSSPVYLLGFMGFSMVFLLGFFMYKTVHHPTVHIIRSDERELRPINNPCGNERLNNTDVYEPSAPILPEYHRVDPFRTSGRNQCENLKTADDCCGPNIGVKQPLDCCEDKFEIKQLDTCRLLESAIFRKPNYEDDNVDNVANVQDNEEDEEDPDSQEVEDDTNRGNLLIPPVQYHEESTQPSNWTPEPLQAEVENSSLHNNPETTKRPSTEMVSSESEDEQNPKRVCNNENEEDDEAPSSGIFRNFRFTFTRQNQNTNANQNSNPESPAKDK